MLGAFAAAWAILRGLWRMDEMQRRIQFDDRHLLSRHRAHHLRLEFRRGAGLPHLRAFAVWPIMGTLWGIDR
jgi:hypothetical protein